jgi:cell division protease FtsH
VRRFPLLSIRLPRPVISVLAVTAGAAVLAWLLSAPGQEFMLHVREGDTRSLNLLGAAIAGVMLAGVILALVLPRLRAERRGPGTRVGRQGRSLAASRTFVVERPKTRLADVAGALEAKEELGEIIDFLRAPQRFTNVGARPPRGVLLSGPPGTGKTLLARAVAGEANAPFLSASGAEFVEVYVGVGAARIRGLFKEARKHAPCIIFIDELDAVGRQRGSHGAYSNEEREQTLNQLLVEMDGFDQSSNIVVLAATNRPDILDGALLRPGRFDRRVGMDRPDLSSRLAILKVHSRNKPLAKDVDLERVARQSAGLSGADLENVLNEAAILTARRAGDEITQADLEEGLDRAMAGPRRKGQLLSDRELEVTSYHEIGHALVAHALPRADKVEKVSIVSRGAMGGYTRLVPEQDRHLWTRSEFEAAMAAAMGGYVAEELIYGEVTTGASNDLQKAASIARAMVTEYGMSSALGPLAIAAATSGYSGSQPTVGPELARVIDEEVRSLVEAAHRRAHDVLTERRETLEFAARMLLERETLEGEELDRALEALPSGVPSGNGRVAKGERCVASSPNGHLADSSDLDKAILAS